ncbi:MAG: NAD(P)/FAD-dependent oxidoreductase [Lachnospiraceae bacterium]|nr:NAD(P)/FAD-dependent oxidoreductase [Lachnospiraceae bacterium]
MNTKIAIIGGGPAGLAAAIAAKEAGVEDVLVIERDSVLGGILNQCIHNGFGLHTFKEELTGPEYAARFIEKAKALNVEALTETIVTDISKDKVITAMSRDKGIFTIKADAVIFAMGCRERPRGALNTPGFRPAGIYSAGTAQRYVNIEGKMPGKEVVILGSGDIGLIMARRMTLEGAKVHAVAEIMPYSGGLKRNIVQCLDDFNIPLKLSTTVIDIGGKDRVESVTLAKVDSKNKPIPGTEETIKCDTLLLSCGLLPENELSSQLGVDLSTVTGGAKVDESLETDIEGVFACGNVLHVHDLVDYVSKEASEAGRHAAEYVQGKNRNASEEPVNIETGNGVRYTVPVCLRKTRLEDLLTIRFRVANVYKNCEIAVYLGDKCIQRRKKQICAPGEMEQVILKKADILAMNAGESIKVAIELNEKQEA